MEWSIYTSLKDSTTEIRLLELFPGRGNILRGRLSHVDLDAAKGTYDTLSYCWGEQTKSNVIIINDHTWRIGKNLYTALNNIRRHHGNQSGFTMWVDALCINQNDTQEKNAQVRIMRDIYSNGRRTYVWLGPDNIWTDLAFKELAMRANWERKHGKGAEVGWWQWKQTYKGLKEEDTGVSTRVLGGLDFLGWAKRSIFCRPWFSRCWVVQELAASRAVTMICGKYQLDWQDMETAFRPFSQSRYDAISTLISIRQLFHNSDTTDLETLLWNTNTFQATDPRDRVFSLLGLVSQDSEAVLHGPGSGTIRVDYGASMRDIYIHATMQCLVTGNSAGILSACLGIGNKDLEDFPSWVLHPVPTREDLQGRDFFAWILESPCSRAKTARWMAAGLSMYEPHFDKKNSLLGLQGIIVDVVDFSGAEREAVSKDPTVVHLRGMVQHVKIGATNIKCYFQWRALSGVGTEEFYRGTTKTTEHAFYEITCPRMPTAEKDDPLAIERHYDLCRRFDEFMMSNFGFMQQKIYGKIRKRELAGIVGQCVRAVTEAMIGSKEDVAAAADFESNNGFSERRRFLRTKDGYMGLGGRHAAAGDKVVLLAGSAAPFLIRPSSQGRYRVVSDAYIVGMMGGELWDSHGCDTIWLE